MKDLDENTKDQLNPDGPPPRKVLLHETTNNWSKNGTTDGGEDNKGHGVLLSVRLPHISNHTKGDGSSSRGQTTKGTANHEGCEVGRKSDGQLPNVDQEQTELEDGPSSEFLTPRRPKLTSEGVQYQEDHGTTACGLLADVEFLRDAADGVGVEGGVEVHGHLDQEDDAENGPFLPFWEGEAQLFVAVVLGDFDLVVGARPLEVVDAFGVGGAIITALRLVIGIGAGFAASVLGELLVHLTEVAVRVVSSGFGCGNLVVRLFESDHGETGRWDGPPESGCRGFVGERMGCGMWEKVRISMIHCHLVPTALDWLRYAKWAEE